MELKFYSNTKLKNDIKRIIKKYLELDKHQIFFFGSRISKTNTEKSDIDIGIEGPSQIPLNVMCKIKEEINELPLLYSIDIIDFKTTSKDFQEVAKKNIEIIYGKN